jgi:hypothetical protein
MKRFRLCFAATFCAVLVQGCGGGSSGGTPYPTGNSMPLNGSISGLKSSGLTLANGMDTVSP